MATGWWRTGAKAARSPRSETAMQSGGERCREQVLSGKPEGSMRYKVFGEHSGLRVSELILGTGTFGMRWGYGAEPDEARFMLDGYLEAGGNFIDTADSYQFGESETLLGEFIRSNRDDLVIGTKYTQGADSKGSLSVTGNSRKSMVRSIAEGLKR